MIMMTVIDLPTWWGLLCAAIGIAGCFWASFVVDRFDDDDVHILLQVLAFPAVIVFCGIMSIGLLTVSISTKIPLVILGDMGPIVGGLVYLGFCWTYFKLGQKFFTRQPATS